MPKNFRQTVRYSAAIGSHDHISVFADCDAMRFCGTSGIIVDAELNIWVLIFFWFFTKSSFSIPGLLSPVVC